MANHSTARSGVEAKYCEVIRIWRENRCLRESSIAVYLRWIESFREYCRNRGLEETTQLTAAGISKFAETYAKARAISAKTAVSGAHSALRTWAQALIMLGHELPRWEAPPPAKPPLSPLLEAFVEHIRQHRGNAPATITKKIRHSRDFLAFLRRRRRCLTQVRLEDIDAFVVACRHRYARTVVADICSSVRTLLRFLHATGRLSADLAPAVIAPVVRQHERPLRSLPWDAVQRILQAVDRTTARGRRDYALLLLMSTYGLGAGEVIRLTLDDIDWRAATVHIVRPKTGAEVLLPLLPAIARALVVYLRRGRPAHALTRHLFVQMRAPYAPLSASSAVRHRLVKHARAAGVSSPYLGSHVLRHSHARRQLELGTPAKVIGDILGHRDAESTSAYVRVATERLRPLALPVPR